MRILQIIHDRERGGVQKLAGMIEDGLNSHRFAVATAYLYPRAGLPFYAKLVGALRMARHIWQREFRHADRVSVDRLDLGGGRRLARRLPASRRSPNLYTKRNAAAVALTRQACRHARVLLRQHRQQHGDLGRVRALSGQLPARDDLDRTRARCAGNDGEPGTGPATVRSTGLAARSAQCRPPHRAKEPGRARSGAGLSAASASRSRRSRRQGRVVSRAGRHPRRR